MPYLHQIENEEHREPQRHRREVRLVEEQHLAPVELVSDHPCYRRCEHRKGAHPQHARHLQRRVRSLKNEPTERHLLHPRARAHEQRAEPQQPEVREGERGERA